MINRAEVVDRNFTAFCQRAAQACFNGQRRSLDESVQSAPGLTGRALLELFESQALSRHLDLMARELRRQGRGYYTIGSSGHEGNAVLGRVLRYSDPAFLHYRSGALIAERSRQLPDQDFVRDTLLSLMAAADDPISGGRHKVWGSVPLCILPQTSTIASHLPRSVGAAFALERARRLHIAPRVGAHGEIPADSIILCSFGDASVNHSVAQGAFNTACYASFQNLPAPILFVCEDNGIGISVHTAPGWIEAAFRARPGLRYFACDGLDLVDACVTARQAAEYVRHSRRPAFLHMRVVRLMGHAGTDPEGEYHTLAQIEATEAKDPLLASAKLLLDLGYLTPDAVLEAYEAARQRVARTAEQLGTPRKLESAKEVLAPLAPHDADRVAIEARRAAPAEARLAAFAGDVVGFARTGDAPHLPENQPPRHLAALLNWALRDLLAKHPEMLVFGEDVAARGGVYYVTAGLTRTFGVGRVFNTLLDETSILGMGIGAGHMGLLPVPEIQYLAYVHNAIDQLRGEACSSQFFSQGQFPNPMVVRVAALAYQKGFGGHFHNDNSVAALRDIPGLMIACPSRGDDAAAMLRTCVALARVSGRVVAFLEPIALYMTRDLYESGDGAWQFGYPTHDAHVPLGEGRVYEPDARDLTIVTFGNGVPMSLRAARRLHREHGIDSRVLDLRWLSPLNGEWILQHAHETGRVLVVDEGRHSGGVGEAILSVLMQDRRSLRAALRISGADTYVPLGPAANLVLPTEDDVFAAALRVVTDSRTGVSRSVSRQRL